MREKLKPFLGKTLLASAAASTLAPNPRREGLAASLLSSSDPYAYPRACAKEQLRGTSPFCPSQKKMETPKVDSDIFKLANFGNLAGLKAILGSDGDDAGKASGKKDEEKIDAPENSDVDVNATDEFGRTALLWASKSGRNDCIQYLCKKGANVNFQDPAGVTAIALAASNSKEASVRLLIEQGADVTIADSNGNLPIHGATGCGILGMVQCIEEANPDQLRVSNKVGITPLHIACQTGQRVLTRYFLEKKVDIDVQDNDGDTPLHIAAKCGFPPLCKFLIESGAKIDTTNSAGKKAVDVAIGNSSQAFEN